MIAELSFGETIVVELLKALFTAILVAGVAALVVTRYRGRVEAFQSELETKRAETAKARERSIGLERAKRDVQSEFIRRVSDLGGTFRVTTQDYSRRKNAPGIWGDPDSQSLDKSFGEWQASSSVLENELEFRYGQGSRPVVIWHQVRDLLTVRFFELRDQADPDLLAKNARGYQNRIHSGLTEDELKNTDLLLQTYHSAMRGLARELGRAEITL